MEVELPGSGLHPNRDPQFLRLHRVGTFEAASLSSAETNRDEESEDRCAVSRDASGLRRRRVSEPPDESERERPPTPRSAEVSFSNKGKRPTRSALREPRLSSDLQQRLKKEVHFDAEALEIVKENHGRRFQSPPPRVAHRHISGSEEGVDDWSDESQLAVEPASMQLSPLSASIKARMPRAMNGGPVRGADLRPVQPLIDGSVGNMERLQALLQSERDLIPGDSLEHVRTLGRGSYGIVEQCHLKDQQGCCPHATAVVNDAEGMVAVKKLKSDAQIQKKKTLDSSISSEELREFAGELLLLKSLAHPNVITFIGCGLYMDGDGHDQLGIVLEFAEHGTLQDVLAGQHRSRGYTVTQALRWAHHVAAGLAFLHQSRPRIIHRDLKPENILICGLRMVAKVSDFGLATLERKKAMAWRLSHEHRVGELNARQAQTNDVGAGDEQPLAKPSSRLAIVEPAAPTTAATADEQDALPSVVRTTRASDEAPNHSGTRTDLPGPAYCMTGRTGTLRYMAPENFRCEVYTHKVDLYSFGIITHELLFRERAFASLYLSPTQIAEAAAWRALRPSLPQKWPIELKELLRACWHPDPVQRLDFVQVASLLGGWRESADADRFARAIAAGSKKGVLERMGFRSIV